MAYIDGTSQPNIGKNSYKIVAEKEFASDTKFFWRTKSSKNPNDPFTEVAQRVTLKFVGQHVGMNYTIEVYYIDKKGKSAILTKTVKVVSDTGSQTTASQQAAPDTGNKSAVINTPDSRPCNDGEEKEITLKIHVYFDGTFGNRGNIDAMNKAIKSALNKEELQKPDIHNPNTIDAYFTPEELAAEEEKKQRGEKVLSVEEKHEIASKRYTKILEDNERKIRREMEGDTTRRRVSDVLTYNNPLTRTITDYSYGYDPTDDELSYTQVYTNIPIMYDAEDIEEDPGEKLIHVYVEGVGTKNGKDDDMAALAVGTNLFGTGIRAKIKRAFEEIKKGAQDISLKNDTITKVEVCVMGFSRGAATTRNFVAEREELLSTLKKINNTINDDIITYKFVGVFDTVCSVTNIFALHPEIHKWQSKHSIEDPEYNDYITTIQRNNVKDCKLAMEGNVEEIVHLTAADEYRLFFPLTNIQTSINADCGFELVLPGSHCDLGGGDADLIGEDYSADIMKGEQNKMVEHLVNNEWYPRKQSSPVILVQEVDKPVYFDNPYFGSGYGTVKEEVEVGKRYEFDRKVVVGYNRIPLSIMLHFAQELGKIKPKESVINNRTTVHADLEELKEKFVDYAKSNHGHKHDTHLVEFFNANYNNLRSKYLHLSASLNRVPKGVKDLKDYARLDEGGELCRAVFNDGDAGINIWKRVIKKGGKEMIEKAKDIKKIILPPYFYK